MNFKRMTTPYSFLVYVEVSPYPNCGFTGTFTSRVGPAKTLADAQGLIEKDKQAMRNTFGGLIEPGRIKGRHYRIFKSAGWEEIT